MLLSWRFCLCAVRKSDLCQRELPNLSLEWFLLILFCCCVCQWNILTFDFDSLKFSCHLKVQSCIKSIVCCRFVWSCWLWIRLYAFVSSAKILVVTVDIEGRSFMKKINRVGPKTLPCGTPLVTGLSCDSALLTLTCWILSFRKSSIHA